MPCNVNGKGLQEVLNLALRPFSSAYWNVVNEPASPVISEIQEHFILDQGI